MPIEVVSQQASTVDDILKREVAILKPNAGRCGNLIKTSRFNLLSFVPITLYELLHPWKRFANFYFLCVGAMQMVPVITLTDGNPSTWMTLSFLVLVDMVVMAAEDMSRHRPTARRTRRRRAPTAAANALRARPATHRHTRPAAPLQVDILRASDGANNEWVRLTWADVMVGDVVRVMTREYFPADLLLLRASDPPGQCWVNTKPLDGESDTKLREALKPAAPLLAASDDAQLATRLAALRGRLRCEEPNDKVNDFLGQLALTALESPAAVGPSNMVLRGCQLRNTASAHGVVVATGKECKINYVGAREAACCGGGGAAAPREKSAARRRAQRRHRLHCGRARRHVHARRLRRVRRRRAVVTIGTSEAAVGGRGARRLGGRGSARGRTSCCSTSSSRSRSTSRSR